MERIANVTYLLTHWYNNIIHCISLSSHNYLILVVGWTLVWWRFWWWWLRFLEHDLHDICIFNANDVILAEMKLFYILGWFCVYAIIAWHWILILRWEWNSKCLKSKFKLRAEIEKKRMLWISIAVHLRNKTTFSQMQTIKYNLITKGGSERISGPRDWNGAVGLRSRIPWCTERWLSRQVW